MKKTLMLCVFILGIVSLGFSQESSNPQLFKKNEIGINLSDMAIFRNIGLSYERIGNPLGYGITGRVLLGSNDKEDMYSNEQAYSITPFLRYYFFNEKSYNGYGFYGEASMKIFGINTYTCSYNYHYDEYGTWYWNEPTYTKKVTTDMAFCIGIGYKFLSKYGFYLDLNLGIGRTFGLSESYNNEVVGKGGVIFGYRF